LSVWLIPVVLERQMDDAGEDVRIGAHVAHPADPPDHLGIGCRRDRIHIGQCYGQAAYGMWIELETLLVALLQRIQQLPPHGRRHRGEAELVDLQLACPLPTRPLARALPLFWGQSLLMTPPLPAVLAAQAVVELAVGPATGHQARLAARQRLRDLSAPPLQGHSCAVPPAVPQGAVRLTQSGPVADAPSPAPDAIPGHDARLAFQPSSRQRCGSERRQERLLVQIAGRERAFAPATHLPRGDHGVAPRNPTPGRGRHRIVRITGEQPPRRVELCGSPHAVRGEPVTQVPHPRVVIQGVG
jgi:hypothetical protein